MADNAHIPTAPPEAIGTLADLREMRDALRAGKRATLNADGRVYVSTDADATTPMGEDQENFIESKLGHVIEMARAGYGVTVSPDGTIFADRNDHRSKVLYDMNPEFNEQEMGLIDRAVTDGAQIRMHADGHIEYTLPQDAVPPSPEAAARIQSMIHLEISSGNLAKARANGQTLAANSDGTIEYVRVEYGPAPVRFPEDPEPSPGAPDDETDTPPTTAAGLDERAEALELGAGAARTISSNDYETAAGDAVRQRDAAARQKAAADGAAAAADAQAVAKQGVAAQIAAERAGANQRASEMRDAGDLTGAEEMAEKWSRLNIEHRIAEQEVASARTAADESRAAAVQHAQDEATFEGQVRDAWDQRATYEKILDAQEDQARVYRQAATETREAERLDAGYADLRARGVPGAERVMDAAAQARARAEALRTKAEDFDKQPAASDPEIPTNIRPNPGPFGEDLSSIDAEPTPMAPSGSEFEMPAMDDSGVAAMATGEAEIEMPALDFRGGADDFTGSFDDQVPSPQDPFADADGMSDVQTFADTSTFAEPEPAFDDLGGGGFLDGTIEG